MKKIPEPELSGARVLTPAELNRIHFGGNRTPISPEQMKEMAEGAPGNPGTAQAETPKGQ